MIKSIVKRFNPLYILIVFVLYSSSVAHAQIQNKDSLVFSIDGDPVYTSEFLKQYKKNNVPNSQAEFVDLQDYAELYLRYKLKVQAAKDQGLDTDTGFLQEYRRYRKQLADKYISNGEVTQEMVEEIYHRMKTEVNASHILLALPKNATPSDTLEVYNKAIDILKQIKNGTSFKKLAIEYSEDPSVKTNNGNLGWFKAYKMVYPFEEAAYEIDVNEVSEPVRTDFGYHLIKKNEERPSKGKVKVSHIMKRLLPNDSTESVKSEIFKIYEKVKEGEDFADLAKQFSDHQATASNGGELAPFGIGDMNSTRFEDVAFSLDENNSISKPFKTKFGWHIVKYNGNIPVEPLDKIKDEVIRKIKTSDRSKRLISNIKKDLMNQYDVKINYELLSSLEERIDESILNYKWIYSRADGDNSNWILKIDDQYFWLDEFLNDIQKQQRSLKGDSVVDKINIAIDRFTYAKLISVHNKNLEDVSPDFASEIKTYYEGLLLFEIMEIKIWKSVQKDSAALKKYYDENRDNFISPTSIDGYLVSDSDKKIINEIKEVIGKDTLQTIKKSFPKSIFKTLKKADIKSSFLPYELRLELNNARVYKHNGQFICVYITKIHPSEILEFKEVRGRVIDQLQKNREEEWITELKSEYEIYMNRDLIDSLRQSLDK